MTFSINIYIYHTFFLISVNFSYFLIHSCFTFSYFFSFYNIYLFFFLFILFIFFSLLFSQLSFDSYLISSSFFSLSFCYLLFSLTSADHLIIAISRPAATHSHFLSIILSSREITNGSRCPTVRILSAITVHLWRGKKGKLQYIKCIFTQKLVYKLSKIKIPIFSHHPLLSADYKQLETSDSQGP